MSEPLDQASDVRPAEDVARSADDASDLKQPSPSADPQPQAAAEQGTAEPMSVDQSHAEQPSVEKASAEQPPVQQDTPMQEDSALDAATPGAVKRQSSRDSHDDGEERAAKRVKEDHPVGLSSCDHATY